MNKKKFTVKANKDNKRSRNSAIFASSDPVTYDISEFGMREIEQLRDLLDAWLSSGLPDDFWEDGVKPAFNRYSGYVFLTNSDYQSCIEVDGRLETWYNTPYEGNEGTYDELVDIVEEEWEAEDIEFVRDLAENRGDQEVVNRLNQMLAEIE